jgi:hypothetical protein
MRDGPEDLLKYIHFLIFCPHRNFIERLLISIYFSTKVSTTRALCIISASTRNLDEP